MATLRIRHGPGSIGPRNEDQCQTSSSKVLSRSNGKALRRPGMTNWGRAGEEFALSRYFEPPALTRRHLRPKPERSERDDRPVAAAQATSLLHPWRRYFARVFDLYFFCLFFFFFWESLFRPSLPVPTKVSMPFTRFWGREHTRSLKGFV